MNARWMLLDAKATNDIKPRESLLTTLLTYNVLQRYIFKEKKKL